MIGEIRQNFTEASASVGLILATALELFVIQTYQELRGIFEDGLTIKKICVSRQTYRQVYRRPKKTRTLFQGHEEM